MEKHQCSSKDNQVSSDETSANSYGTEKTGVIDVHQEPVSSGQLSIKSESRNFLKLCKDTAKRHTDFVKHGNFYFVFLFIDLIFEEPITEVVIIDTVNRAKHYQVDRS